jgi:hypothetical protein
MLVAQVTFPDRGDTTARPTASQSREARSLLDLGDAPARAVIRHEHARV